MPDLILPNYMRAPMPVISTHGVVSSDHPVASELACKILAQGGNAVDAAFSLSLTLGAVCPYYTGIGGGGFALVWMPGWKAPRCLDFRETGPAAAHPEMFLDGRSSTTGGSAVGIPASLSGWSLLHREFGKLPWADILEASAEVCEAGFDIDPNYLRITVAKLDELQRFPELCRVFLTDPNGARPHYHLKNPDLAATYRRIGRNGVEEFYEGETARRMVEAVQAQGGCLTLQDLSHYRPRWLEPVQFAYRNQPLFTVGPPSAGGIQLCQLCALMEGFELRDPGSAGDLHLLSEAMKLSFYERSSRVADPAFCDVPVDWLLDRERLGRLASEIHPDRCLRLPEKASEPLSAGGTASFTAATFDRGVVMVTESINLWWGSMLVPERLGFPLNNVMDDFSCHPGQPDAFGLYSSAVNDVRPGKRPASSSTPLMLFREGRPVVALGSAGGPRIPTSAAHMLVHHIDYGMNIQQSLSWPRVHHQWRPDEVLVEPLIPGDVRRGLEARGHRLREEPCRSHGAAAALDWEAGILTAGGDFRSWGAARGI